MSRRLVALCLFAAGCASTPDAPLTPLPAPLGSSPAPPPPTTRSPEPAPAPPPRKATPDTALRAAPPTFDDAPPFPVPPIESFRLANGMRVMVLSQPGQPFVHVRLSIARSTSTPLGVARVLAASLASGTRSRPEVPFRRELDEAGARWTTNASVRDVMIDVTSPSSSLARVLDLVSEAAVAPLLDPKLVAYARDHVAVERARDDDQPGWVAGRLAPMALYGEKRPEDQFVTLRPADLRSVNVEDVALAWKSGFVPSAATLVVVGDVTARTLRPLAERMFGGWAGPVARKAPRPKGTVSARSPRLVVADRPHAAQASVTWAANVPEPGARDWPALLLANDTLGDPNGGKIGRAWKSRSTVSWAWTPSLAPSPSGEIQTWRTEIPFAALTDTLRAVDDALRSIRETELTDAELTAARLSTSRRELGWLASLERAAGAVGRVALFDLPLDDLQTEPARIAAVTAADVRRVASTSFDPARMKIVIVGDWTAMKDQLLSLGWGPVEIRNADGDVLRVETAPPPAP